jgi:hypothetical protein
MTCAKTRMTEITLNAHVGVAQPFNVGYMTTIRRYGGSARLQVVLAAMIDDLRDALSTTMIMRMVTPGRTHRL